MSDTCRQYCMTRLFVILFHLFSAACLLTISSCSIQSAYADSDNETVKVYVELRDKYEYVSPYYFPRYIIIRNDIVEIYNRKASSFYSATYCQDTIKLKRLCDLDRTGIKTEADVMKVIEIDENVDYKLLIKDNFSVLENISDYPVYLKCKINDNEYIPGVNPERDLKYLNYIKMHRRR